MPRGKKKKVVVIIGPNGQILKHKYHNNHRNVPKEKVADKMYDPLQRKHVGFSEMKVKDERHSS
ncbi:hypothetical protein IPN35_05415 [Candidatus Peregrinibacteria bacterium]|nr:MAG: hypothetical protein IPN35_05415 [Candidatus Peregrinibacteria bacterium]